MDKILLLTSLSQAISNTRSSKITDAYNTILKSRGKRGIETIAKKTGLDHRTFPDSSDLPIATPEIEIPETEMSGVEMPEVDLDLT